MKKVPNMDAGNEPHGGGGARAWRFFALPALLLAILALRSLGSGSANSIPRGSREEFDAGAALVSLEGGELDLGAYRGRVLVLNCFATWCGPCVAEMPSLGRLHERLGGEGLSVLAISAEPPPALVRFAKQDRSGVPLARDTKAEIFKRYGVTTIPRTFVLDREGRVAMDVTGAMEWDSPEMISAFEALLAES